MRLGAALPKHSKRFPRTTWKTSSGNPILSSSVAWESQTTVQEPNVLYDGTTWKMWYTGGYSTPAIGYATCTGDPTVAGNWTKYASNPVLGQGTVVAGWASGVNVQKFGTTYYLYYYDGGGGGNLKVSTSSDGVTWAAPSTALTKGVVAWMPGGWANCFVWGSSGSWKMLVEGSTNAAGSQPWRIAYATSSNSTPDAGWTVQGTGPISSLIVNSGNQCGGPWLANGAALLNGQYQLFYHAGNGSSSTVMHAQSPDLSNWTVSSTFELAPSANSYQQTADPSVIEVDDAGGSATSYLFYDEVDNNTPTGRICVATYPSSIANLTIWDQ